MTQIHPDIAPPATENDFAAAAASTPSPDPIEEDLRDVERALAAFLSQRERDAAEQGDYYVRLWRSIGEAARGGKRLRPRFVLTAFHGLGGGAQGARRAAVGTAVAFELLHTAFLLHDDVIDRDTMRRGRPNVVGEFSADALFRGAGSPQARLWGESAAILAGDLLLHGAAQRVARLPVADPTRGRLLDILDKAVFVTAAGELADVGLATGMSDRSIGDVLSMTEHKTAAYSAAGPLSAGAVLAGADDDLAQLLTEYGRLVGTAFQLGDDLLGVYGDEAVTGKSASSDLRRGKETTLVAFARGTSAWAEVESGFGDPELSRAEAARLAAALERCGARDFVERLLAQQVAAAIERLDSPLVPSALAAALARVALDCVGRSL
jgi:geranylgeranyl diphosphate synthase type II